MIYRSILFIFILLYISKIHAQNTPAEKDSIKEFTALRIANPPKIDGVLHDEVWKNKPLATNFVMIEPGDGNPSRQTHPTEVKVVYDDQAIYIAAYMRDNEPDRIMRQFTQRDNIEQSDFFFIDINTYNDGENQTRFVITSAGALADAKMSGNTEDYSYNVVWEGEISFDQNGWYAEIKIPYAALRFPKKQEQVWGIQFARKILHLNELYSWNYINKSVGRFSQYNGLLKGIKNIEPPVRLSFYPYTSAAVEYFQGTTKSNFSAGLDFKYGINAAFTLDATLIPDFGQTAFDKVELNLGPFEQTFSENRAFFTEGTELFTKGNLFYSRRIGDAPIGFNSAQRELLQDEIIIENPEKAELLNALKISGRTDRGLGIGFFNAITQETYARFRDTIAGHNRKKVTEPLANYNVFVLDQQYNQNSSITLINTNVTRNGHFRDGNVSGFLFDIFNKSNSFNFTGEAKISNVNKTEQNITGFASTFAIERTKGNFRYEFKHDFANETYDINDLGLNFTNNYNNLYAETSYRIFEPTKKFNEYRLTLFGSHKRRYDPNLMVGSGIGVKLFAVTTQRFAFGGYLLLNSDYKDFFEPRRDGKYVIYNKNFNGNTWISTDYRKRFAIDLNLGYRAYSNSRHENIDLRISPRFRISDKFSLIYSFEYGKTINRESFVALQRTAIIFGNRDMESVENSIQGSYNFNTKQAINVSFRNFWSAATIAENQFYSLQANGRLTPAQFQISPDRDPNVNFNIWNLDLTYRWEFAPGSEAILLYRNAIFNLDNQSELGYGESLGNLFEESLRQNISLRLVYYIDYNKAKNIFKS